MFLRESSFQDLFNRALLKSHVRRSIICTYPKHIYKRPKASFNEFWLKIQVRKKCINTIFGIRQLVP